QDLLERKSMVLWRRPFTTLKYGTLEAGRILISFAAKLISLRLLGSLFILAVLCYLPGPHDKFVAFCKQHIGFASYWIGLGVLSSVGFGSGLHTFVLYLGPHIASVTMAAYECQTLDFPKPPYPDKKICPDGLYFHSTPDVWSIMSKVRLEVLFWGIGTALGELPPFFMARSARVSALELQEASDLQEEEINTEENREVGRGSKLFMERVVKRAGFFGILLCASVPNPLFDLAGLTCGHFLIPFWKFFLATIIGKAVVKSTLQQWIVVVAFNEDLIYKMVSGIDQLPWMGPWLQQILNDFLKSTKQRMHSPKKTNPLTAFSVLINIFEICAIIMVAVFVVSLVNSLAQIHCKRRQEKEREVRKANLKNNPETGTENEREVGK
ncbi:hypothetical protein KR018_002903, partial [Drosophila ironensis]